MSPGRPYQFLDTANEVIPVLAEGIISVQHRSFRMSLLAHQAHEGLYGKTTNVTSHIWTGRLCHRAQKPRTLIPRSEFQVALDSRTG